MKSIFKSIILLLNILVFISAFILWVFNNPSREVLIIVVVIANIIFILIQNNFKIYVKNGNPFGIAIALTFLLLTIQFFISGFKSNDVLLPLSLIVLYITFLITLSSFEEKHYLNLYSKFSVYLLFSSILCFILLHLNIIDKFDNLLPDGSNFLFDGNRTNSMSAVSFPGYLSFIYHPGKMIPFFSEFGTITSIFHEPHISTWFITPGIFIYNYLNNKKIYKIIVNIFYLFFVLLSLSATNISVLLIIYFVYIISNKISFKHILLLTIIILSVYIIGSNLLTSLNEYGLEFVLNKFNDDNGSRLHTQSSLSYLFSPSQFWGSGALSYPINNYNDIGFINFILFILFYISIFYGAFKLIINKETKLIGLSILYFFLHSLKFGNAFLIFPIIIFIMYIGQSVYKNTSTPNV
jgi:hypothetical protein